MAVSILKSEYKKKNPLPPTKNPTYCCLSVPFVQQSGLGFLDKGICLQLPFGDCSCSKQLPKVEEVKVSLQHQC